MPFGVAFRRPGSAGSISEVASLADKSAQQVKEIAVFHGESAPARQRRREPGAKRLIEILNVVVDDKETRIGIGQQTESQIRRPEIDAVVVLDQPLEEHPSRKGLRGPQSHQVGREISARETQVVVTPLEH